MTLPPFFQFFFSIPVLEGWGVGVGGLGVRRGGGFEGFPSDLHASSAVLILGKQHGKDKTQYWTQRIYFLLFWNMNTQWTADYRCWGSAVGGRGRENGNRKTASKNLWLHPKQNKAVQNFLAVTCHIYAVQTDVNTFSSSSFSAK